MAAECLGDLAPGAVSLWRQQGTYPSDFPDMGIEELVPVAYHMATAAGHLARLAADAVAADTPPAEHAERSHPPEPAAERAKHHAARILDILERWDPSAPTPTAIMGRPPPPEPPEGEPHAHP